MNEIKKKVLIVDDDKLLSEALLQLFVSAGNEAKIILRGDEAEAVIDEWNPDVILLDIMLPGKNGVEIVKDVCGAQSDVCKKILVMTTLNDSGSLAKSLELGITNYIQKNTSTPQYVFDVATRMMNK